MEHLNALASICESAERMPVLQKPIVTYPATLNQYLTTCSTQSSKYVHQSQQYFSSLCNYSTTLSLPTPPITPISSAVLQQGEQSTNEIFPGYPNPIVHCKRPMNPVIRNVISYASYMQYLDENWPEKCSRRGSAVIRASLYTQISDCLKGGVATARFRYWVKKSGFFLIEKLQQDGSYAPCIAVPLNPNKKSDVAVTKCTRSYRLVAKLEEFVHLIGEYHNDSIGHYGIRKTYQMIQQDYTYLPRSAIAKFVQLCDVCSVRGKRTINVKPKRAQKKASAEEPKPSSTSKTSVAASIAPPFPEDEIEIATESISSTSVETNTTSIHSKENSKENVEEPTTTTSTITSVENTTLGVPTECPLNEAEQKEDDIGKNSLPLATTSADRDSIDGSHDHVQVSVKQLLEGLTWEEMLQLYTEGANNPMVVTPTSLGNTL